MVVVGVVHLVVMFVQGAYKSRGEFVWFSGILVLFITFGFGLTGYLLPYDQMGYWASQVRTGIVGSLPLIGELARTILIGGSEFGNLTLTRFASLHTIVLPVLTIGLLLFHFKMLSYRKETIDVSEEDRVPSWAYNFLKTIAGTLLIAFLLVVAILIEAPLEPPADPSSMYEARPEWYFLFLFQLLKYFEGPMTIIGTVILPGVATGFLFALPFLDRVPSISLLGRRIWAFGLASIFCFAGVMSAVALQEDANSEKYQLALSNQQHDAREALRLADENGVGLDGQILAYTGYKLFDNAGCLGCHQVEGRLPPEERWAPKLDGYLSRKWFRDFLLNPMSNHFYGGVPAGEDMEWDMPGFHTEDIDIDEPGALEAIVEYMAAQSGRAHRPPINLELAERGKTLVEDESCSGCHSIEGEEMDGPALNEYGSRKWLEAVIRKPHAPHLFGERNSMPGFTDLPNNDVRALISYLESLR